MSDFEVGVDLSTSAETKIESLLRQIAASQAREQQLRETLEYFFPAWQKYEPLNWKYRVKQALSKPTDTTALSAMITKAGEVMRERAIRSVDLTPYRLVADERIRALAGVTLEDLQK